jgi:hypothetical protein
MATAMFAETLDMIDIRRGLFPKAEVTAHYR